MFHLLRRAAAELQPAETSINLISGKRSGRHEMIYTFTLIYNVRR
jgi:hypothetical protein